MWGDGREMIKIRTVYQKGEIFSSYVLLELPILLLSCGDGGSGGDHASLDWQRKADQSVLKLEHWTCPWKVCASPIEVLPAF